MAGARAGSCAGTAAVASSPLRLADSCLLTLCPLALPPPSYQPAPPLLSLLLPQMTWKLRWSCSRSTATRGSTSTLSKQRPRKAACACCLARPACRSRRRTASSRRRSRRRSSSSSSLLGRQPRQWRGRRSGSAGSTGSRRPSSGKPPTMRGSGTLQMGAAAGSGREGAAAAGAAAAAGTERAGALGAAAAAAAEAGGSAAAVAAAAARAAAAAATARLRRLPSGWLRRRQQQGAISVRAWTLLQHCR